MKKKLLLTAISFNLIILFAQNEFYIKGDNNSGTTEVYVNDKDGTNPTLFVKGEIINNQGVMVNDNGDVELTGNFTNTANGTDAYYSSTGIERFSGDAISRISGNLDGTSGNLNQLYDLKVNKDLLTNYVELNTNVHINNAGSVDFTKNGILRTDVSSHGNDGSLYAYYLLNQNTANSSISNASLTAGTANKYIEGKLRWSVLDGANTYAFPVGGSINGVEPIGINLSGSSTLTLEGYIVPQSSISSLGASGVVYQDVGNPTVPNSTVASGGCDGGADGILDKIDLNVHSGIGWAMNNVSGGTVTSYNIVLSAVASNQVSVYNPNSTDTDCESVSLLYVSKDGIAGGLATNYIAGAPQSWPTTPGYNVAPQTTGTIAGVSGYKLDGMSSFSLFGAHSTSSGSVALPVELISLTASPINNEYIKVEWTTATEINNDGFDVLRSEDGLNFERIAWVQGNGNTNEIKNYAFDDMDVVKNKTYYYRLNQKDFDGAEHLTNVVSAKLFGDKTELVTRLFPNPTYNGATLQIQSSERKTGVVSVFNMLGQTIYSQSIEIGIGITNVHINTEGMAAGTYQVSLHLDDEKIVKPLVLQSE